METIKFKTNINCSNCVAKVSPVLNDIETVKDWKVDTEAADKILTVNGEEIDEAEIIEALNEIGFSAEKI